MVPILRRAPFVVLPFLLLLGCSQAKEVDTASKAPALAAPSIPLPTVTLPDFATLVERHGVAVVNISTTSGEARQRKGGGPAFPGFPGLPEGDPLNELFRKFFPPGERRIPDGHSPAQSLGSGFIVSKDGVILTNAHVVDEANEVTVRLTDKREFKAKVLGIDRRTDVAVLKIEAAGLPTVSVGDPSQLRAGDWVLAIGSPFGFDNSVTAGIVSAKGRSLPDDTYVPFIQTDVAINPGNSGGPLFNLKGEVVGINSQIYSRSGGYMGIAFSIPIDVAMKVADQLRTQGKVTRGRIGVQIQELSGELAQSFGLPRPEGALVASVERSSPAFKAGIVAGDVILSFNGKAVKSSRELPVLVGETPPGSKVPVEIWRDGKKVALTVSVGELAPDKMAKTDLSQTEASVAGLVLAPLTASEREEEGIEEGVRVREATGEAAKVGLRVGDVIVLVGNVPAKSVSQVSEMLKRVRKGTSVPLLVKRGERSLFVALPVN